MPAAPDAAAKPNRKPKAAKKAPAGREPASSPVEEGLSWIDAGEGYQLALEGDKLVCRNDKGKRLASLPKPVAASDAADQLHALKDWLAQHRKQCLESVDAWMLRSLPVPREVVQGVFEDADWRRALENAVVAPVVAAAADLDQVGFLKGVDPARGVGMVDLDGETRWLKAAEIVFPHPILIPELPAFRELAVQLSLTQGISQLFRETFPRPANLDPKETRISQFADGKFAMLMHASGKCKTLGFRVRGGYACCPVIEGGRRVEARYWIGSEAPDSETWTGDLGWVDAREMPLSLGDVGDVAFSEGMRMASSIFAARVVDKEQAS